MLSKTNITQKNLNLLNVFHALLETENGTKAARRLRMSQPNLSRSLRILRQEFQDPLFVRSSRGLVPTEKAKSLAPLVREAISKMLDVYAPKVFDPAKFIGRFTIATTDYLEFVLMTQLADTINKEAPFLTLNFRPSNGFLQKAAMENGNCDLTILVVQEAIPPSMIKQDLFKDPYVGVVRKDHPILNQKVTLESFLQYGHVMISPQGELWAITDEKLQKIGKKRRLVAATPNALSAALILSNTDLILIASLKFVEGVQKLIPLSTFKTPFDLKPIQIAQIWHERSHSDPLHRWIREKIKKLL